jgi:hypothetical protein
MYKLTEENKVKEGLKKQVYQSTKKHVKPRKYFKPKYEIIEHDETKDERIKKRTKNTNKNQYKPKDKTTQKAGSRIRSSERYNISCSINDTRLNSQLVNIDFQLYSNNLSVEIPELHVHQPIIEMLCLKDN